MDPVTKTSYQFWGKFRIHKLHIRAPPLRVLGTDSTEPDSFCFDLIFILIDPLNTYKYLIVDPITKTRYGFRGKFRTHKLQTLVAPLILRTDLPNLVAFAYSIFELQNPLNTYKYLIQSQ